MPNDIILRPYWGVSAEGPVERLGNGSLTLTRVPDGTLLVSLPGIGRIASIEMDTTDPYGSVIRTPDEKPTAVGFARYLEIHDVADEYNAVFERTIRGTSGGISYRFVLAEGAELLFNPTDDNACTFLTVRYRGESVLYFHIRGRYGFNRETGRLFFPYPRTRIRIIAAPLRSRAELAFLPLTERTDRPVLPAPHPSLPAELAERIRASADLELSSLSALKTAAGFYRTGDGRTTVREQQKLLLFFLEAGETERAVGIMNAVRRFYELHGFLSPYLDPEDLSYPQRERFPETDALLAAAEMIAACAEHAGKDAIVYPFSDLAGYACTVLRDASAAYRLPYDGTEPVLAPLPFLTRVCGSARATAEWIGVTERLAALFPENRAIRATAPVAARARERFFSFFRGENGSLEEHPYSSPVLPAYLWGTCQICGLRGRAGDVTGWLVRNGSWYYCEECAASGFTPDLPRQPQPHPRSGKTLPPLLSLCGFSDDGLRRAEKALYHRVDSLSLSDASLLLYAAKESSPVLIRRILTETEALEKEPDLALSRAADRTFALAALLHAFRLPVKENAGKTKDE